MTQTSRTAAHAAAKAETPLQSTGPGWIAVAFVVAATVFFCAGDIAAKALSETLSSAQIAWMRYVVFSMIAVPVAMAMLGRRALSTDQSAMQAGRAIAIVGSTIFFITGLGHLAVPDATAINFISPMVVMALSVPLLGEKIGIRRWSAAAVAFLGVLIVVQPGSAAFSPAAALPLAAAVCWAVSSVLTRMMGDERPETTMAWSALAGVVLLAPALPFGWSIPDGREAMLALLAGLFSTAGNWMVVLALRMAPASVLAPFFYVQIISASALSWAVFSVPPSGAAVLGGAVIAASGVYAAYRTHREKQKGLKAGDIPQLSQLKRRRQR